MDLATIALLSVITTATAITFLMKITSWSKILRFQAPIDVLFTAAMFSFFAGTLGGSLVAAMSGLLLSLVLTLAKAVTRQMQRLDRRF